MEPYVNVPFSKGKLRAYLKSELRTTDYRDEYFTYTHYWYECEESGEKFSTEESDRAWLEQIYNQYRDRHKIPYTEELIALRERCGLSAAKMSALLGLGINQYAMYERGEVPLLSIGRLLYALCHSKATLNLYLRMFKPKELDGRNKPKSTRPKAVRGYNFPAGHKELQVAEPALKYEKNVDSVKTSIPACRRPRRAGHR